MSLFDVIRENVTAKQVFEYYGIKVNRYGMCCCPFHSDKHPSMKVDTRYYCFGCGEKGDAVDFVSKYYGLGPKDAAIKICDDFHLTYDKRDHTPVKTADPEKSLLLKFEEQINIVFCHLYIFHFLLCLPVLGIGLFLFLKNFAIFLIQFFDLRKFTLDLGESFLSSFAKRDSFPVLFKELFAITALTIFSISVLSCYFGVKFFSIRQPLNNHNAHN